MSTTNDLNGDVTAARESANAQPLGSLESWEARFALGHALILQYQHLGRGRDLTEARALFEALVNEAVESFSDRIDPAAALGELGGALLLSYRRSLRDGDLENAIATLRKGVAISSDNDVLNESLNTLGICLRLRYVETKQPEDLDEAITVLQRACAGFAHSNGQRLGALTNLAVALRNRHGLSGRRQDLQEAMALYRYCLDMCGPENLMLPGFYNNLGACYSARYLQDKNAEDLRESIAYQQKALALMPPEHPDRVQILRELSACLETQYEITEDVEDLMAANMASREADRLAREDVLEDGSEFGFTKEHEVACPQCGPLKVRTPFILELEAMKQRPDVLDLLRTNRLNEVSCPTCGDILGAFEQAPLLLACGEPNPILVFFPPAYLKDEAEEEGMLERVVGLWRRFGDEALVQKNPEVIKLPPELFPVVVEEGVEVAKQKLEEKKQTRDPLQAALSELLIARAVNDRYRILYLHPELLDESVEAKLLHLAAELETLDPEEAARYTGTLRPCAEFLRQCRETGLDVAFEDAFSMSANDRREVREMTELPADMQQMIREAKVQTTRYERDKSLEALDKAATLWGMVVADEALNDAPSYLTTLLFFDAGFLFLRRYETRNELADIDQAVPLLRFAWRNWPVDDPLRSHILRIFLSSLGPRYLRTGDVENLDEALALGKEAVDTTPPDHDLAPVYLNLLGQALYQWHLRTGQLEELHETIAISRRAHACAPTDPAALQMLADALCERYEKTGALEDLDEAIAKCRLARNPSAPEEPVLLNKLGLFLLRRYERTSSREDLEEAIQACRGGDEPHNLGIGLYYLFDWTGRSEDLDEAIDVLRRAALKVSAAPATFGALAGALRKRAERTGRMEDWHERVALHRRALKATNPTEPHYPLFLSNLGVALLDRGTTGDLDEALDLCLEAAKRSEAEPRNRQSIVNKLSAALMAAHQKSGDPKTLDAAIDVSRLALKEAGGSYRDVTAIALSNLGDCLMRRYRLTNSVEDEEEAFLAYQRAVNADSIKGRARAVYLRDLALAHYDRYQRTKRGEDLVEAFTGIEKALEIFRQQDPSLAFTCAKSVGLWAFREHDWRKTADMLMEAMSLVETLTATRVLLPDKQSLLLNTQGLYANAAYCLGKLGDLEGALLAMETGRARIITEMLDRTRIDFDAIARRAPELLHRYVTILNELVRLDNGAAALYPRIEQPSERKDAEKSYLERLRAARAELHATVEAIREIPEFDSFLGSASIPALLSALEPGVPAIYLAATPVGGLALIVAHDGAKIDVEPLWLDALTIDKVSALVTGEKGPNYSGSWLGDYGQMQIKPGDRAAVAAWYDRIEATNLALWDLAMAPILARLNARFPGCERVVLVVHGLLSLLPLHAASNGSTENPRSVLDEIALQYAPSLRAFGHSRDLAAHSGQTQFLAIDDPRPSIFPPLQGKHEIDTAAAYFAKDDVSVFSGVSCQIDDVFYAIQGADICHFSCHGRNDWLNPGKSGLLMSHDQELTVAQFLSLSRKQARMAVLSACETGIVGTDTPDEVLALPAAFLQTGFAGVVASLWSVYDISASLLMAKFYELWLGEQLQPVNALRKAQMWLRDLKNREIVTHLERLVPELVPRMALETAETLHFSALVQDPDAAPFAHPVHWAAFYLTGV